MKIKKKYNSVYSDLSMLYGGETLGFGKLYRIQKRRKHFISETWNLSQTMGRIFAVPRRAINKLKKRAYIFDRLVVPSIFNDWDRF